MSLQCQLMTENSRQLIRGDLAEPNLTQPLLDSQGIEQNMAGCGA